MIDQPQQIKTRRLGERKDAIALRRMDWPPELTLPKSIIFHLDESSDAIVMPLNGFVVLGRSDEPGFGEPTIDLSPYQAQYLGVSRRHVVISTQNNSVMIKDLGSTNGTYLNDYLLQPMMSYRLRNGDDLRLGELSMHIVFATEMAAEPTK